MSVQELVKRGPYNIRRRLLRDILSVVLVTSFAIVGLGFWEGMTIKDEISSQVISESSQLIKKRFVNYLTSYNTGLTLLARMGASSLMDDFSKPGLEPIVVPFLDTYNDLKRVALINSRREVLSFTRTASGYVADESKLGEDAPQILTSAFQGAMNASDEQPVHWSGSLTSHIEEVGLTASIRVNLLARQEQLVVVFFIPAAKFVSFISDIVAPKNVVVILYSSSGLFISRKQNQQQAGGSGVSLTEDPFTAPRETVSAIEHWREGVATDSSVVKFRSGGMTWWAGYSTLTDKMSDTWISVVVPETDIIVDVRKRWFQLAMVGVAIFIGAVLFSVYLVRKYSSQLKDLPQNQLGLVSLADAITKFLETDESPTVEFKSTIRTNLKSGKQGKEIELAWLKTIVAFMNSDGGILLIGVGDDSEILGIEVDGFASEDKCGLHFKNLLNTHIGAELSRYVHFKFCRFEGKTVVMIETERVRKPVFLRVGKTEEFYVRSGPSSMKLTMSQMVNYLAER